MFFRIQQHYKEKPQSFSWKLESWNFCLLGKSQINNWGKCQQRQHQTLRDEVGQILSDDFYKGDRQIHKKCLVRLGFWPKQEDSLKCTPYNIGSCAVYSLKSKF